MISRRAVLFPINGCESGACIEEYAVTVMINPERAHNKLHTKREFLRLQFGWQPQFVAFCNIYHLGSLGKKVSGTSNRLAASYRRILQHISLGESRIVAFCNTYHLGSHGKKVSGISHKKQASRCSILQQQPMNVTWEEADRLRAFARFSPNWPVLRRAVGRTRAPAQGCLQSVGEGLLHPPRPRGATE